MRSVKRMHANTQDFASGQGAARIGGRWSRVGLPAVYTSLSPVTAAAESYQEFDAFGFAGRIVEPRVFCGARVRLSRVLDLTDGRIRRKLGFSLQNLVDEDWLGIQRAGDESWTQAIGRGAHADGFEGLLAPSAQDRPGGRNLVIFPDRLLSGSVVEPMGLEDLPPHPTGK